MTKRPAAGERRHGTRKLGSTRRLGGLPTRKRRTRKTTLDARLRERQARRDQHRHARRLRKRRQAFTRRRS